MPTACGNVGGDTGEVEWTNVEDYAVRRRRRGGDEKVGRVRGRVSWNAAAAWYIRAGPCLCRGICVFIWNTGEPHRQRENETERDREKERERMVLYCGKEGKGRWREEPMAN